MGNPLQTPRLYTTQFRSMFRPYLSSAPLPRQSPNNSQDMAIPTNSKLGLEQQLLATRLARMGGL